MTQSFNFDLAGVAGAVQFGKTGNQVRSTTDGFAFVAADGATPVRLALADPLGPRDGVTLQAAQSLVAAATAPSLSAITALLQTLPTTAPPTGGWWLNAGVVTLAPPASNSVTGTPVTFNGAPLLFNGDPVTFA